MLQKEYKVGLKTKLFTHVSESIFAITGNVTIGTNDLILVAFIHIIVNFTV